MEERVVKAYVGATRTHFYIAIISELPVGGELFANHTQNNTNLVWDDSVEIWANPTPGEETYVTYHMLANSTGYRGYQTHVMGNVPREVWYGWNGNYNIANGLHDGFWHCMIEIPVESLAKDRQATDGKWIFNLCRDFKQPWAWASIGSRDYHPHHNEIVFTFLESGAAAIQAKQLTDVTTKNVQTVLSMYNPGPETLNLSAHLYLKRNLMPEVAENGEFTIAPGETAVLKLKDYDVVSNRFALFTLVREKDGPVCYSRHFTWGPPKKVRWETNTAEVLPVDFSFAHYPYLHKMRLKADITHLASDAKLEHIDFVIREKEGGQIKALTMQAAEFDGKTHEVQFDVPELAGIYEIVATPVGEGTPGEPVVKILERHVYEWEHQNLGTSRKVYAPFTPITVNGNTLGTALKEYDLNDLGLLDRLRPSQQRLGMKDVLAAPMRYTATISGTQMSPSAPSVRITCAADDQVIAESTATIGGPRRRRNPRSTTTAL